MTDLTIPTDLTPPAATARAAADAAGACASGAVGSADPPDPVAAADLAGAVVAGLVAPDEAAGAVVAGSAELSAGSSEPGPISAEGAGEVPSAHLLGLLDALVVGLRSLGGGRLEECLRVVGRCEARLAGLRAEKVGELARWRGEAHAAEVLRGDLKQSRGAAKSEVQFAERLGDLPATAEALAEGAITPQHARAIADAAAHTPVEEAALLGAAETEPADVFARTVRDHVNERSAELDLEERRRRQRSRREATIKQESDGMYKLFGLFDPVAGARIETALGAMAKKLWHAEDAKQRSTPAQRYADALEALITRPGADATKAQGTNLLVIANYDIVAGQLSEARLVDGTPVAPSELLRLALEANILPALFDTKGQPLWLGRAYRHASTAQRIALAARDRGCAVCGAANSFCQAHHVIFWEDGGPTDIDNLVLLCSDCHHTQIHGRGADLVRDADGNVSLEPPPNQPPAAARTRRAHKAGRAADRRRGGAGGTANGSGTVNKPLRC